MEGVSLIAFYLNLILSDVKSSVVRGLPLQGNATLGGVRDNFYFAHLVRFRYTYVLGKIAFTTSIFGPYFVRETNFRLKVVKRRICQVFVYFPTNHHPVTILFYIIFTYWQPTQFLSSQL